MLPTHLIVHLTDLAEHLPLEQGLRPISKSACLAWSFPSQSIFH